jgi:hypothetical protein
MLREVVAPGLLSVAPRKCTRWLLSYYEANIHETMQTKIGTPLLKTNNLSQTLAFHSLQCYTTRTPVGMALSPNERVATHSFVEVPS